MKNLTDPVAKGIFVKVCVLIKILERNALRTEIARGERFTAKHA